MNSIFYTQYRKIAWFKLRRSSNICHRKIYYRTNMVLNNHKTVLPSKRSLFSSSILYNNSSPVLDFEKLITAVDTISKNDIYKAIKLLKDNTDKFKEHEHLINYTLGELYSQMGDNELSYDCFKKALDLAKRKNGSTHKSNGKYFEKLGDSSVALSKYNEAEEYYLCALDCYDKDSEVSFQRVANLLSKLTDNMNQMGHIDEQIMFLKREIDIYENELNQPLSPPAVLATRKLIDIYLENQDSESAYLYLPKIFDYYVQNEDMNNESMANFSLEFAKVCVSLPQIDINYAKKALFVSKKYFKSGDNKDGLLECYEIETYIYDCLKDKSNLIKTFEKILELYNELYGPDYIENVRILNNIALLLGEEGKEDESREIFEKAIDLCVKNDYINHEYYSVAITGFAGAHIQKSVREEQNQNRKQ